MSQLITVVAPVMVVFLWFYLGSSLKGFIHFSRVYGSFSVFMCLLLQTESWYFTIVGWEMMRLCSYYLISTFNGRLMANSSSACAMGYNRVRDICLFSSMVVRSFLLVLVAVCTKSSLLLAGSWLPFAMEGPTPVSALLHSSTMVVARVYMVILFNVCQVFFMSFLVVYGLWMGKKGSSYYDHKRIVAFSTSSQLVLVVVFSVIGGSRLGLLYVIIHACFKSLMFMVCGWCIHANFSQSLGDMSNYRLMSSTALCCFCMARLVFLRVAVIKDPILIGVILRSVVALFIVYVVATLEYCVELVSISVRQYKYFSDHDIYRWVFVGCSLTSIWGFSMLVVVWPFSLLLLVFLSGLIGRLFVAELDAYYKFIVGGVGSKIVGSLPALSGVRVVRRFLSRF